MKSFNNWEVFGLFDWPEPESSVTYVGNIMWLSASVKKFNLEPHLILLKVTEDLFLESLSKKGPCSRIVTN